MKEITKSTRTRTKTIIYSYEEFVDILGIDPSYTLETVDHISISNGEAVVEIVVGKHL